MTHGTIPVNATTTNNGAGLSFPAPHQMILFTMSVKRGPMNFPALLGATKRSAGSAFPAKMHFRMILRDFATKLYD